MRYSRMLSHEGSRRTLDAYKEALHDLWGKIMLTVRSVNCNFRD